MLFHGFLFSHEGQFELSLLPLSGVQLQIGPNPHSSPLPQNSQGAWATLPVGTPVRTSEDYIKANPNLYILQFLSISRFSNKLRKTRVQNTWKFKTLNMYARIKWK